MKTWIPPGTIVCQMGPVVTIIFRREEEAGKFCDWIQWLDNAKSGTEMIISRPEEERKPV